MQIGQILVPQGAEYNRVRRGLRAAVSAPAVVAIPLGPQAAAQAVTALLQARSLPATDKRGLLLVGLCGSLSAERRVGDIVLYRNCIDLQGSTEARPCDRALTDAIQAKLPSPATFVSSITSDRLIHRAAEKRQLRERHGAAVVDMEGAAVLQSVGTNRAVAMLRVVSDDCTGDLPDLSPAIAPDGALRPLPMFACFLRQPMAAARLIRGSLRGLGVLETAIAALFAH